MLGKKMDHKLAPSTEDSREGTSGLSMVDLFGM
jgi:hypothetical protein